MVVKIFTKLGRRMDEYSENIRKYHMSHRAEEYNKWTKKNTTAVLWKTR